MGIKIIVEKKDVRPGIIYQIVTISYTHSLTETTDQETVQKYKY